MSKRCTIVVRDEVYCHIGGLAPADHKFLWDKFGILVEGAHFQPKVKLGIWDGKIRFFDSTGKLFIRLLDQALPYIEAWGYEIDVQDLRAPVSLVETRIHENWFLEKGVKLKLKLRPYQVQAVNKALDATSGIVEACTGSGKTWMVAALCDVFAREGFSSLVIVPSADLVKQTLKTFRLGLLDVGEYSGSTKDLNHQVVVGTWQSLKNNPVAVSNFKVVIIDEAHGATAKVIGDLITKHGKNCAFRYGFTGTIPLGKVDQLTLRGSIGEKIYEITAAELIEQGYLAKLQIEPVEIIDDDVQEEFTDYAAERKFLEQSSKRLDLIADLIISKAAQYGNTLVLVKSVKFGKMLQRMIKDSVFLYGDDDTEVRAEWYDMFEKRDDLIVIATTGIAAVGISIDRIFNMVLIDVGRSFVKCIQAIGRGLRIGHDKDRVHFVDVHSNLNWSMKHWKIRLKYYKAAKYPVLKSVKIKV